MGKLAVVCEMGKVGWWVEDYYKAMGL